MESFHQWRPTESGRGQEFDVLVTADQDLFYQQNLTGRALALVVLGTNKLSLLEAQPERIVWAVDAAAVAKYQFVEYKMPPKPRPGPKGREDD